MDNVSVSEEGIPYVHYLPILKYPSGKSGYNKKIKQLLKEAGLHRQGSGAVSLYTMLELADRFKLMNLAFGQEDYRVDKNLEVIDSSVKKDS